MEQKFLKWSGVWIASVLAVSVVSAQETNEVEQLRKELRELRDRMQSLEQRLGGIDQKPVVPALPVVAIPETPPAAVDAWKPTDPLRVSKGGSYMDISLDGLFAVGGSTAKDIEGGTQLGGHDPN